MSVTSGLKADWLPKGFEEFNQTLNGLGQSPIQVLRTEAYETLVKEGFASTKSESWKYTNVKDIMKLPLSVVKGASKAMDKSTAEYLLSEGEVYSVVLQDGMPVQLPTNLPTGVSVRSLAECLHDAKVSVDIKEFIAKFPTDNVHAFELLNTAFLKEGVVIDVDPGVTVDKPIHVLHAVSANSSQIVSAPRTILRVGQSASVEVVEHFVGLGAKHYLVSAVAQVEIGEEAKCNHYKIQEEAREASHVGSVSVLQAAKSHYKNYVFNFGGAMVRNEVRPVLQGEEIDSELFGLNVIDGDQFVDNFTILDHAKPSSESNELYKGIYGGKAKGIFSGTIIVREGAHGTNAIQSNQSLLVSDSATSNSRPQLKIWADDVKCTHGATVGQIDEEAMFYLRSRGLSETVARRMLMRAFVGEVVAEVESEVVRQYIDEVVERELEECLPS